MLVAAAGEGRRKWSGLLVGLFVGLREEFHRWIGRMDVFAQSDDEFDFTIALVLLDPKIFE